MHQDIEQHKRQLAQQLLRESEQTSLLGLNTWLLVARRLAKVTDNHETYHWLGAELSGYDQPHSDPLQQKYARLTGRLLDAETGNGDWRPIAEIEADTRCPYRRNIEARLQSLVHDFATEIYYRLEFGKQTESIFQFQRSAIDMTLSNYIGEILGRIPVLYDRLTQDDQSAVGPVLETCRRMIDTFSVVATGKGKKAQMPDDTAHGDAADNRVDLIQDYIDRCCKDGNRAQRLMQSIKQLVDYLAKANAHFTRPAEARYLIIHTYILLAEIFSLMAEHRT